MLSSTCFDHGWAFYRDTTCAEVLPAGAVFEPVDLPHDWQIWHTGDLYADATGWYRKRFTLCPQKGRRYQLAFDGVYMDTTVFLNGTPVAEWKYGCTPFRAELTAALCPGENELLVRCRIKNPNSRWYAGAGIYRGTALCELPACHFVPDGLYLCPREGADGRWAVSAEAEFSGPLPAGADVRLRFSLFGPDGMLVGRAEQPAATAVAVPPATARTYLPAGDTARTVKAVFSLKNPLLWDLTHPALYRVEVALLAGDSVVDTTESRFGCRTLTLTPDRGLFLNHQRVVLHGVCMHQDLGCLGSAFSVDAARRQLLLLKEMGVNSIRTGHIVPAKELMALADELGFLINSESFDCWAVGKNPYDYGRFFAGCYPKDIAAWVRRDRNHPSLLFWCIGNEIYDTHAGPEGLQTMRALLAEVARHDPARNGVPTLGSNYMPWENTQRCADVLKVIGYNYAERCYAAHHKAHPDWVIYGSETGSLVQSRGVYHFPLSQSLLVDDDLQCSSLGNSRTSWGARSLESCFRADRDHPFTLGQYLWSGFDYIGEPTPYHTKNSYFGMIDTAGFPKDAFYTCQAGWLDAASHPMVHLIPSDWCFNPGQRVDVCAVSNAAAVELFLNGRSLGRRLLDPPGTVTANWQLAYEPGTLTAVAYNAAGQELAWDSQTSYGDSAALRLSADRQTLAADGRALAFVTISAVDAAGSPVRNANDRVTVEVTGGDLLGLDNGDSADFEEYKTTSRRLFSGLLLAVVAGSGQPGPVRVRAAAPGLAPAELTLLALPFAGQPTRHPALLPPAPDREIAVRQIVLSANGTLLTPDAPTAEFSAQLLPARATLRGLTWRLTDDAGNTAANAVIEATRPDGAGITVRGLGDGPVRVRCMAANGRPDPVLISVRELRVEGMGRLHPDPYSFLSGSLYGPSAGELGNGNERGVSTMRGGESWVAYPELDFGRDGSDTVEIPIFELAGEPTEFRFWRGVPHAPGSRMIGARVYHKPKQWNVYQTETFQLDERLTGLVTFGIELHDKVHIKGFRFQRQSRAFASIRALDCDSLYGDTFRREPDAVCGIGNNVSLVFHSLDFGAGGCRGVRITGRSALKNNTLHLVFSREGEVQRRIVEFAGAADYTSRTFLFDQPVTGRQDVTFLFLPGCRFDFKSFTFMET